MSARYLPMDWCRQIGLPKLSRSAAKLIAVAPSFYVVAVTLIASAALLRWLPETLGVDLAEAGETETATS